MKIRKAIYPGSFQPFTIGHLHILKKAIKLFDDIIVVFAQNPEKPMSYWDPVLINEQIKKLELMGVRVIISDMLTVDIARKYDAKFIIRGIRNSSDYEYEKTIARYNQLIDPSIETVFLTPDKEFENISSSFVRELKKYNKDYSQFVL